jgi:hypothetical protein
MTRPTRTMLIATVVAALVAIGAGYVLGRSAGEQHAPGLAVQPVERIDRPKVGPQILVPTPIAIPVRLPE